MLLVFGFICCFCSFLSVLSGAPSLVLFFSCSLRYHLLGPVEHFSEVVAAFLRKVTNFFCKFNNCWVKKCCLTSKICFKAYFMPSLFFRFLILIPVLRGFQAVYY